MNEYYQIWQSANIIPLLELAQHGAKEYCNNLINWSKLRKECIDRFGFVVPNEEALTIIAGLKRPIIEIGAGTGYWSYLLQQRGVDVIAIDDYSGYWYQECKRWTEVKVADCTIVQHYPERVAFCCWPYNYLEKLEQYYKGDTLIWIGEDCTDMYNAEIWEVEQTVDIPQWGGIHDRLEVLKRL